MSNAEIFDLIPENVVVLSGDTLLSRRHMPVPPNVTAAIRDPKEPGHLYEVLREEFPADHPLTLLNDEGSRKVRLSDLPDEDLTQTKYLVIEGLQESCAFESFQNTVAILRGPNGCPWDKKQTHQSLREDFLQEVYELLDGLDRNDRDVIVEEMGDVLLHIVLQAQIGVDHGEFTMSDVVSHINDKMVFRHEHVFGSPERIDPDQVMLRWEQLKQKEREKKHKKGGLLDGVSRTMPALSMAHDYQKRAAKAGFEWEGEEDLWKKLHEELQEFRVSGNDAEREEELGDILFCVVNLARWHGVDPEIALRMANSKFYERVRYVEATARDLHTDLFGLSREEKERAWNECKAAQK